jgi:hypothetical protein
MSTVWRFKVRNAFKARVVGADLPAGQTVIAAIEDEPDVTIEAGEVLVSMVEPPSEPGTQTTFAREDAQDSRLYRSDVQTFSSTVEEIRSARSPDE